MGIRKLRHPNAQSFTHVELQNAMLETIAAINQFSEEAGVNEVCRPRLVRFWDSNCAIATQPSLMNFCVTDGVSVVATRYVSSRNDAAASLVRTLFANPASLRSHQSDVVVLQWFSSGTTFSEYAEGGHYKMSKTDKRENIILVGSES